MSTTRTATNETFDKAGPGSRAGVFIYALLAYAVGMAAIGWLYLVAATFVTNHFDLFGLRQAWLHLRGKPYTAVPFTRNWMYRYSRHPMMAGILMGLWATPQMHADHLALAVALSTYIAVGVAFEERELAGHFGDKYRRYRQEVGALLPRLRG